MYFIPFANKATRIPQLSREALPSFLASTSKFCYCKSQRSFVNREELEEKHVSYHVRFSIQCYTFSFAGIGSVFSMILLTTNSESK